MFTHLHTHSHYSFLRGLPSPADLVRAAARQGMDALALTDTQSLSGAIEFYQACQSSGIHPILGLEIGVLPPKVLAAKNRPAEATLVLLAMDASGWASLCRLSSFLHGELGGASISFERLAQGAAGLICMTGGRRGLAAQLLAKRQDKAAAEHLGQLNEVFSGRLYVELQIHSPEDRPLMLRLAALAHRQRLPVVASHDVHYLEPGQSDLQRVVTAIRLNQPLEQLPAHFPAPPGAYFRSSQEMQAGFAELPAAVAATQEIAARCHLELPLGVPHYPELSLPEGSTAREILRQRAEAGAKRRYLSSRSSSENKPMNEAGDPQARTWQQVQARLEHELRIIAECGYEALFLIMEEIVGYARQNGVPIASRGSASSSLVSHCLGITSPDPIRLNLYFERFLNPARATPPDIDTDLCSRRRDEVIRFVYKRFGQDRVAMVGTVNRFRSRSALREAAKAYGLAGAEIKVMVDSLSYWRPHHMPPALRESPYGELEEHNTTPRHREIFQAAKALIGLPRHLSVHAGGVVIAPGPLSELVPTQLAPKGVVITQLDLDSIEALGLVKIDLLGIRGLTVLGDVGEAILSEQGSSQQSPQKSSQQPARGGSASVDVLEAIPENDPLTSDLLRRCQTIGCFQIESPGMRATLKEIQAQCVDDLMVALALYRPGPLTGGQKDAFVRRHRGEEAVEHLHPVLAPLLEDTYGVILYQEQVLRIAHELAGLSLADADLLRRAMSHFDPGEKMRTLKEKFISASVDRTGMPEATAEKIWDLMAAFAGYGFPKAHAASYAQVAWRAAWCKGHYPAVFMAAVLANWGGFYSQRVYLTEARRMGLALRPPQVNQAQREFSVRYQDGKPVLFMGLDQVRDLTRRTQSRILRERPFYSLGDFLARVDPRPIEAENLVRCGALGELGRIPDLLQQLKDGWRLGQLPLFSLESKNQEDWTLAEKVDAQAAVLGASIDAHPLELAADRIGAAGALTTVEAAARLGHQVRAAGMRQTWLRVGSARGEPMYFLSLEDLEGMLEVFIAADVYRKHRRALSGPGPYLIEGVVELNQAKGEPYIRAQGIWKL